MYPVEVKKRAIEMLKSKSSVKDIVKELGVSETTVYRWKKELRKRRRIKRLSVEGKLKKAESEVAELKGKSNEPIRNSLLAMIERRKGNIAESKRLEEKVLEQEPDNLRTVYNLIEIAIAEGDIEREKQLLELKLKINPKDVKAMTKLASLIRKTEKGTGKTTREKELIEGALNLEPKNIILLNWLIDIAVQEGDEERQLQLLQREAETLKEILDENQNDEKTKKKLKGINERIRQLNKRQAIAFEEKVNENSADIKAIRELIYESNDALKVAEQIKEMYGEEQSVDRELILAELYYNLGLVDRARKSLKSFRDTLQDVSDIKRISQAIRLVQSGKTRRLDWEGMWFNILLQEQSKNRISQASTKDGEKGEEGEEK